MEGALSDRKNLEECILKSNKVVAQFPTEKRFHISVYSGRSQETKKNNRKIFQEKPDPISLQTKPL